MNYNELGCMMHQNAFTINWNELRARNDIFVQGCSYYLPMFSVFTCKSDDSMFKSNFS